MAHTVSTEKVALARRRYLDGASVRRIMSETGLSQRTVYRCLSGRLDDGSGARPAPIPRRGAAASPVDRHEVVAQLWRAASQQVQQIEERLAQSGLKPRERDSDMRALAVLVRTLRELAAFDDAEPRKPRGGGQPADDDDDPVPRDIDEFRRELARRMDAFVDRKLAAERGVGTGIPGRTEGKVARQPER